MNKETIIWMLLALNFGIATIFTAGLANHAVGWRAAVRNWVGAKAVWLGVLAVAWAAGWVGFTDDAPRHGWLIYAFALLGYTYFHLRAYLFWVTGRSVPPVMATETMVKDTDPPNDKVEPLRKPNGEG